MKVLLLTHYFPPEIGAAQRRLGAFSERWNEAGHEVTVITGLPHYPNGKMRSGFSWSSLVKTSTESGARVVRVPFLPTTKGGPWKLADQSLVAFGSMVAAVCVQRPDVIVASVPGLPTLVPALVARKRWKVPLVVEMRDAWPDLIDDADLLPESIARKVGSGVTHCQQRADAVITVTPTFRKTLIDRGIEASRVECISNGIDISRVPWLGGGGQDSRPLHVLYLGTMGVSQGLESVVEALAQLDPSHYRARFIGDGTELDRIRRKAQQLGVAASFESPIAGSALWDAYRWADTCLVPLRDWPAFSETVPSKIYEIAAVGKHLTLSGKGDSAEIVHSAGAGAVVPPDKPDELAHQLRRLDEDRSLLCVGEGPRQWVEEHADYNTLARRYEQVFVDLLKRDGSRHGVDLT